MNVNITVKPQMQFTAFYLFFVLHTVQVGVGIMGVPMIVYKEAKHDAWISIIIAGIALHITLFVMFYVLNKYENADLFGIQQDLFGKFLSKVLGFLYLVYVFVGISTILLNYTEVVQVYIFPKMPTYLITSFLLILMIYTLLGGLRVVVGVAFLFFILTIWLAFILYFPIRHIQLEHYFPILNASPMELLRGAFKTTYTVLGFEVLLFVYPFVQNKNKAPLFAHLAVFFTTILTFVTTFISIGYFSGEQLNKQIWATLSLFKIVQFSILERFDYVAVAIFMFVILPNLVIFSWLFTFGAKRLFNFKQKYVVYALAVLVFAFANLFEYRINVNVLTDYVARIGFYFVFVYPWFLLICIWIKRGLIRMKGGKPS